MSENVENQGMLSQCTQAFLVLMFERQQSKDIEKVLKFAL